MSSKLIERLPLEDSDRRELLRRGIRRPHLWGLRSTVFRPRELLPEYSAAQWLASGLCRETQEGLELSSLLSRGRIVFPYWEGSLMCGLKSRVNSRYDMDHGGKYLTARGFRAGDHLWYVRTTSSDGDLVITEGELKAMVLEEHGFWAASVPGVHAASGLANKACALSQKASRTFIVLDTDEDVRNNRSLLDAARVLCKACGVRRAVCLFLPSVNGLKVGVDDFLLQQGPEELEYWLDWAWRNRRLDGRAVFC